MQRMARAHRHGTICAELDAVRASISPVIRLVIALIMVVVLVVPAYAAKQTIQKVDVANLDNAVQITINSSQPLSIEHSRLGSLYIVFDLNGSLMKGETKKVKINSDGVKIVRCGWFRSTPPVARIVVSTTGYSEYSIRYEDGKRRTVIKIEKIGATARQKESIARNAKLQKPSIEPISTVSIPEVVAEPVITNVAERIDQPASSTVGIEPRVTVKRDSKPVLVASAAPIVPRTVKVAGMEQELKPLPRITLDFVASDIHDVLKALAMQGRVNIVASPEVKGDVTASLNNVTVEDALKLVANLSGFRFSEMDGTYVVGTQDNLKSLVAGGSIGRDERATGIAVIKYADAGVVGKILEKEFGMVQVTASAGEGKTGPSFLVLSGRPGEVEAAKAMVESIENASSAIIDSSVIEIYEVKYADINELATTLSSAVRGLSVGIGPNQGFKLQSPSAIIVSAEGGGSSSTPAQVAPSKTLILQGTPEEIEKAKIFLAQIDIAQPQIVIEAKVIDVNNSSIKDLGIQWGGESGALSNIRLGELRNPETRDEVTGGVLSSGTQALTIGRLVRSPLLIDGILKAVVTSGKGKILANPNVLALDGKPASIFIGDEVKYVTRIEQSANGTNVTTETARVGIQLHTISRIGSDGYITMDLHPEVSVITRWKELRDLGFALPEISRRFVDSTIRVKDGETIVIGGLIRDEDIATISGIPFLKDLPIIGSLFKYKKNNKVHSEIVMFITPRVITDSK